MFSSRVETCVDYCHIHRVPGLCIIALIIARMGRVCDFVGPLPTLTENCVHESSFVECGARR